MKLQKAAQEMNEAWKPENPIDIKMSESDLEYEIGERIFNLAKYYFQFKRRDIDLANLDLIKTLKDTLSDGTIELVMPLFEKRLSIYKMNHN
jgi:hypothetical protein